MRIKAKKAEYKQSDLHGYIRGKMAERRISQSQVAKKLDIEQPTVSIKLERGFFTDKELIILFEMLGTTSEEIARLLL